MAEDQGAIAFRTGQGGGGGGGGAAAGGSDSLWNSMTRNAVVAFERLAQAIPGIGMFLPKMSNAGEVGVTAGLEFNKVIDLNKPMLAASGMSVQSNLSRFLSSIMKMDFNGVGAPQNVSMADLGSFTPDFTPSQGIQRGGPDMMA